MSILITCAIAQHFDRITFAWYPLLAVTFVIDDQDENSLRAARGRILGTITGGLVTFLVHTIMSGWIGILVSLLITIPLLRRLGWSNGLSTAVVVTVMFLSIDAYTKLDWAYVFNRSLDTLVGILVALLVGRLLWPKNRMTRLQAVHEQLHALLHARVNAHSLALQGQAAAPTPIAPALITRLVLEMQSIIAVEQSLGPRHVSRLNRRRWLQCLSLWRCQQVRWMLVERLIERLHKDNGANELPVLGRYLVAEPRSQERLSLESDDAGLSLAQRIALEEQVTRFGRLLNSQQRLDRARGRS
ncbi:hypothetical protein SynA1560_02251 [Synechococcus sp. A15-60]|nr:hypothetical protein SynA1560_02251 [Synechococcus sp. A15-60]